MAAQRISRRTTIAALLLMSAAACEQSSSPPAGYPQPGQPYGAPGQPYGQPGQPYGAPGQPYGAPGQPYGQPGQPPPPGAPPQGQISTAVTPFGVLLSQLPQLPAQLPPLPAPDAWMQQYWPFPMPGPQPQPQPPPPQPGPAPPGAWPAQWVSFEDEVLRETNAYRAMGAVCGGKPFGPAPPLSPHPQLRNAARGHSRDMAVRNYFDHRSPEGTGPMQRAQAAGFSGGFVGENIAAGQDTPREVVRAWMDSPGHCLNVMEPDYRYLGVGYYFQNNNQYGSFWTQNFGG